jgi:hypothetical protein
MDCTDDYEAPRVERLGTVAEMTEAQVSLEADPSLRIFARIS